jgi:hypothetical protein
MKALLTIFLVTAALSAVRVVAQDDDRETAEVDATIDEITVVGARSLGAMRAEVTMAEDQVYALFNDLNEDDRYDIICKKEARIGSQIPKRVCLARMYRDALAEETVDEDSGFVPAGTMTRSSKHQKILQEKMRALAMEHPELLQALKKRRALDQEFKQARDNKYGDR